MISALTNKSLYVIFLLAATKVLGQQPDSLEGAKYFTLYEEALSNKQYQTAEKARKKAIYHFRKADLLGKWLSIHRTEANYVAEQLKQPFIALDKMDSTLWELKKWRKLRTDTEYQYLCYFYQTQAHIAKQYAEDFVRAKIASENAYRIFHEHLGGHYDFFAGYSFFQLGNTYVRLGEFESAKHMFEEGLAYSKRYNYPPAAKFPDHGGMYVTMGNYAEAKRVFLEGIDYPNLPEEDFIFTKLSLAECLARMNDFEGALKTNKELEAQLANTPKALRGKLPEFRRGLYENYGIIYAGKNDWGNALLWYKKALKTARNYHLSMKREEALIELEIGNALLNCGRAKEALDVYHNALKTVILSFNGPVAQNPEIADLTAENVIYKALHGKARAFLALDQPENALRCYELIPVVEAKLRATHAYESSSLLALGESRKRFDEAIDIAWLLYEQSDHERQYADRAFLLSEQARGMLLLESLVQAQLEYKLPDSIRRQEHELEVKLAWYDHEIAAEKGRGTKADKKRLALLDKERFDLKQEKERLKATLRENFPDYVRLTEDIAFLSVAGVPSLLRPAQAMVDYFLTEKSAYIFFFDVAGMFSWRRAELPEGFRDRVAEYSNFLFNLDETDKARRATFLQTASECYQLLLAPELAAAAENLTSLLIIPDDALVFIPFETLLRRPATGHWRGLPWLLRDFSIGYAYSATLLQRQQDISAGHRRDKPVPHQLGGFAPSYAASESNSTRGVTLLPNYPIYDIKSTQDELRKVHAMTGGLAYYKEQAEEQVFKDVAAECRILLLAMHGFANNEQPELSCLLFGIPTNDSIRNNVLYASEIQVMRLHADLAVLSACNTGFSKQYKGEGVYSLARAFAAAGVPCTVMSLWPLHESTAPKLVEAFFRHLKAHKTKDEALQLAKLEFIADDDNFDMTHPFYWAGVMATGDMCALDLTDPPQPWWWYALAVAGLAGLLIWWLKKRKRR